MASHVEFMRLEWSSPFGPGCWIHKISNHEEYVIDGRIGFDGSVSFNLEHWKFTGATSSGGLPKWVRTQLAVVTSLQAAKDYAESHLTPVNQTYINVEPDAAH